MFKLLSPTKYSPSDAIHLLRCFFHHSEQFLNSIFMFFSASVIFCFTSFILANHFLGLFSSRETNKKKCSEQDQVIWEGGAQGHAVFGQKLLNTQHGVGRCACKSPILKWANALKESSKKIHLSQMQPLTTMPAGTLIEMDSWNTHLAGEAYTTRGQPSRR